LALFVYTTLWDENILVRNGRIIAANGNFMAYRDEFTKYINHFVPLTDTEIKY